MGLTPTSDWSAATVSPEVRCITWFSQNQHVAQRSGRWTRVYKNCAYTWAETDGLKSVIPWGADRFLPGDAVLGGRRAQVIYWTSLFWRNRSEALKKWKKRGLPSRGSMVLFPVCRRVSLLAYMIAFGTQKYPALCSSLKNILIFYSFAWSSIMHCGWQQLYDTAWKVPLR